MSGKRVLQAAAVLAALAGGVRAQTQTTSVRVFADQNGARFWVDGTPYTSAQNFLWPVGTKHILFVERNQTHFTGLSRYTFSGWSDSTQLVSSSGDTIAVLADPAISFFKAAFTYENVLRIKFSGCDPAADIGCKSAGTVSVGGAVFATDVEQWFPPGAQVVLQANPGPGFVFAGWGQPLNYSKSFVVSFVMNQPTLIAGIFEQGKHVTFLSNPEFLYVAPDRTPMKAPAEVDWAQGSTHVLGAVSPQTDKDGKVWVFGSWSNGAELNGAYNVTRTNVPETLTGHFVRAVGAGFTTNPPGLKIKVDGRDNWPSYNFVWGVGEKHTVSAADQVDAQGRRYVFQGWSNGGPATQELTVLPELVDSSLRLAATFQLQGRLTIQTSPPGLPLTVDGVECRGSCVFDRAPGSQARVSVPSSVPVSEMSRLDFASWSDEGAAVRTYTFGSESQTLTAFFNSMHRLQLLAEPSAGAAFRVEPSTADGYYQADTQVAVMAEARPGFRFQRWEGDLSGTFRSGTLTMSVPRSVRAFLATVPYVDQSGVRNAAGDTRDPSVAPGSIASIYGVNLAPGYEAGPASPLAQSIAGVTVRLDNRFLPLLFVSPEQINVQIPSDLEEGAYNVIVRWDGQPEVTTELRIARNAPGLFQKKIGDLSYAVATHEDGSEITRERPARRGEVIAIYGTGFGPFERRPPDGFALPLAPDYPLIDALQVLVADAELNAIWAGGAAGQVGTALARVRIGDEFPAATEASIKVRINGRESNSVLLPVE